MKPFFVLSAALAVLPFAQAKELDGTRSPTEGPCPTVEEAIAKMKVPDGYEVRCFASEPMLVNPVGMTWDEKGRLWVAELFEYPKGSAEKPPFGGEARDSAYQDVPGYCQGKGNDKSLKIPRDRIVCLEDTDNDGKADKRTVFVEGLNIVSGILVGDGGVYVGQQPHLLHFRDKDGDGHADQWKAILTGFGREDTHELLNGFIWGPDGWLYFTHGVFTHSKVRVPGRPKDEGVTFNAGIGRVEIERGNLKTDGPSARYFEVYADGTSNPWGCDYDAAGNFFVSACVIDHLFHMAPGGLYQRQGGSPEYPYAYELLPSIVQHKHFRAAYAGITVYQGGIYPNDTHGHVFIGNIHDNAIHEEKLEPVGATFKATPVRDFLRAENGWFRPVSTQTGPDGFLWIMDWCDKYPCYQNAQANPEGVDRERGRIWRVCYVGSEEGKKMAAKSREMPLTDDTKLLFQAVQTKNSWTVRHAARLLRETHACADAAATKLQRQTVAKSNPLYLSLWELLDWTEVHQMSQDKSPLVRCMALRYIQNWWATRRFLLGWLPEPMEGQSESTAIWRRLAADADSSVQFELAVGTRRWRNDLTRNFIRAYSQQANPQGLYRYFAREHLLANGNAADRTLPFLIWTGLEPRLAERPKEWLTLFAEVFPKAKPMSHGLAYKAMRRLCDTRKQENMDLALAFIKDISSDPQILAHALEGLVRGQEAGVLFPSKPTAGYLQAWTASTDRDVKEWAGKLASLWGDESAIAAMMKTVLNESANLEDRIASVRTVRKLRSDKARAGIATLLGRKNDPALTAEAMRAAAELGGDEFPALIILRWADYSPALSTAAAEVLTSRPEWAEKLLQALAEKESPIKAGNLPITVHRYFALAAPDKLKKLAREILGAWNESNDDIKKVIAQKRKISLEGEPDLDAGRTLFLGACAVCHKFHGGGLEVGPELIGSGRSSLDALINNIVDPNQVIGRGYENVNVTTKDNRILTGRVIEDAPTQLKLLGIGAREEVIAKDQIAKREDTTNSLMPAGFNQLPDADFRNLVWYLLAPPEEGPLTPEKKAALAAPVTEGAAADKPAERKIDWESVSLWNPDWKVTAPEFEGTPVKLAEFTGRKNVLMLHPFEQARKNPAKLECIHQVSADHPGKLVFFAAAHDQGDWELIVTLNKKEVRRQLIKPDGDRWKKIEIGLEEWKGQKVEISLENWANDWKFEFSYWSDIQFSP